jgi:altered-inheritance-of-mitochondria protein 5
VLSNIYEPQPPAPEPRARQVPIGLSEMAKDRWNREVEGAVKWLEEVDWRRVRERLEERVEDVVRRIGDSK